MYLAIITHRSLLRLRSILVAEIELHFTRVTFATFVIVLRRCHVGGSRRHVGRVDAKLRSTLSILAAENRQCGVSAHVAVFLRMQLFWARAAIFGAGGYFRRARLFSARAAVFGARSYWPTRSSVHGFVGACTWHMHPQTHATKL